MNPLKPCCMLSEAYGVYLFAQTFTPDALRIVSKNPKFVKRIALLTKTAFGVAFDLVRQTAELTTLSIENRDSLSVIISALGFSSSGMITPHVNLGLLEDNCCRVSFLRGAFLAGGTASDPASGAHLEIRTRHRSVARETASLMLDMEFEPKLTERSGSNVLYFKKSSTIEDFLTLIGAPNASMNAMDIKIERELRRSVSRRTNCDTANISKSVEASGRQLECIEKLKHNLSELPKALREAAEARLNYPELSLTELGEMAVPPVSKSAMAYRFRKLSQLAGE